MNSDRYTRTVLTVIALALAADAARGFLALPEAHAAEPMRCEIVGTVKVEGKLGLDSSSYSPIIVKSDDFAVKFRDSTIPVKVERVEGRVTTHNE